MYQLDYQKPGHLHFIGIGGISMSGLAEILAGRGYTVSGSDMHASSITDHLTENGIQVVIGQTASNIVPGIDCVVYTAAIHPDNPELVAAKAAGIPLLTRAELLGQIMSNYEVPVAVAGTHGKTTTTSMLSHVLLAADLDPTITVGGILPSIGGNIRVGYSPYFVAEACEYSNSFLEFYPRMEIILNVDADHLDFFKDLDEIAESFHKFACHLPEDGTLIINRDMEKYPVVVRDVKAPVITFGMDEKSDYYPMDVAFDEKGCGRFTCMEHGEALGEFVLRVPGIHNVTNALSVIAACRKLDLSPEVIRDGLAAFTGTDRRFQFKGKYHDVDIIDDYAHHPTEIMATLTAAARYPHRSLWVAFQPHTYTRTKALLPEFAEALSHADHVILADIYAAREKNTIGISSDDLRREIENLGGDAAYIPDFPSIEEYLRSHLIPGDLLITMGAGNILEVGEDLLS